MKNLLLLLSVFIIISCSVDINNASRRGEIIKINKEHELISSNTVSYSWNAVSTIERTYIIKNLNHKETES